MNDLNNEKPAKAINLNDRASVTPMQRIEKRRQATAELEKKNKAQEKPAASAPANNPAK